MKVYLVFQESDQDKALVLSVHSTREGAEKKMKQCGDRDVVDDELSGVILYYSILERQIEV